MTRYELVFRHPDGDRVQHHDQPNAEHPRINGELILDGQTYMVRDVEWLFTEDGSSEIMRRFVCTLVPD